MSVSEGYLDKVRFAVRRTAGNAPVDAELTALIEQCRADLTRAGVPFLRACSEDDPLVLGAVRCFVRWQFGIDGDNAERNREDYQLMLDNLRKSPAGWNGVDGNVFQR